MIQRNREKIFDKLSDVVPNPKRELRKGQKVMFTNEYGITFGAYEILGFCEPCLNGRCVYLDKSSYWFPAHPEELTVQENGKEVENETATENRIGTGHAATPKGGGNTPKAKAIRSI